jgi:hypothetical protein
MKAKSKIRNNLVGGEMKANRCLVRTVVHTSWLITGEMEGILFLDKNIDSGK